MTQTTLDFSPTFLRHHTTPTIIMLFSFPLSLTLLHHHHHHYLLKATTTYSFFTNIIIIIIFHPPPLAFHDHLLLHHIQEPFLHTIQGEKTVFLHIMLLSNPSYFNV
ncbi:hypothetical protein V8G54_007003 [Vigna mungo]|uniref:Uncharacterized protein n=1 Tax=Vigna mungo TaxID=3915 RepID=A0AAQ3S8J9_VIGMU